MEDEIEDVKTITPQEAGKILHKNAEFIRAGLRQKVFPFGVAVQSKSGQYNYLIFKDKLLKFAGIKKGVKTNEKENIRSISNDTTYSNV